jgi:hypothetical protein
VEQGHRSIPALAFHVPFNLGFSEKWTTTSRGLFRILKPESEWNEIDRDNATDEKRWRFDAQGTSGAESTEAVAGIVIGPDRCH